MTTTTNTSKQCLIAAALYITLAPILVVTFFRNGQVSLSSRHATRNLRFHGIFTEQQARDNAGRVKRWRQAYEDKCQDPSITSEDLLEDLQQVTKPSRFVEQTHEDNLPLEKCNLVLLDFGANVGDSLQKMISSGIPKCKEKMPAHHPSYNGLDGSASTSFRGGNMLVSFTWNRMNDFSSLEKQVEDYCYFGIEGNPAFTERLSYLEKSIMRMDPRPVRRAHFFTSTVGAGVDGPTLLYLDTVNTKENSWGSSMLANHVDVQKSANTNEGQLVEAHVQGMTLGKLLQDVVIPKKGSHVMIKMDIEGGEFALMEEAASSGIMCSYMQDFGVKMDLIMEAHNEETTGPRTEEEQQRFKDAMNKLKKCGLNFYHVRDAGR